MVPLRPAPANLLLPICCCQSAAADLLPPICCRRSSAAEMLLPINRGWSHYLDS